VILIIYIIYYLCYCMYASLKTFIFTLLLAIIHIYKLDFLHKEDNLGFSYMVYHKLGSYNIRLGHVQPSYDRKVN